MRVASTERAGAKRTARPVQSIRAVLGLAVALACGGAAAAEPTVTVMLDRAQVLAYPPTTETVIVGNPIIADITMLKSTGMVILTGKGFGDTNLLFLDRHGTVLKETRLRVGEAPAMMVVQRGPDRESYACHPRCEPTVALGDSQTYMQRAIGDIQARNGLASGAAAAAGAGVQAH